MKPYLKIKRVFDFFAALLGIIFLSPLYMTIAIFIKIIDGDNVLFKQQRPGKYGKIFIIYKFKTMINRRYDKNGRKLTDMERMTKLGSILRRTSIDELPQLINILKGEMSFIGPRPLLVRYLKHYTPNQARRHNVLPGISGWAQVNGRNSITWAERFELDCWYVDNISLFLDIKILFKTIGNILSGSGVNKADDETMSFFDDETAGLN